MSVNKRVLKSHKSYQQQLDLLKKRGMLIGDEQWAIKKLKQVGYYRLSGYWYRYREPNFYIPFTSNSHFISYPPHLGKIPKRRNRFHPGTTFEKIYSLYLFDCELKILLFDGIARIETYMRAIISYTIGEVDPLGYRNQNLIDNYHLARSNNKKSNFEIWLEKVDDSIENSKDDCIHWNKENYEGIPIWAVTEIWDFGTLSKYYGMLKDDYKLMICRAIFNDNRQANTHKKNMKGALQHLNIIRNKCAHHARIWNNSVYSPRFNVTLLSNLQITNSDDQDIYWEKIFGTICLIWKLIKLFSNSSEWLAKVIQHIENLPNSVNDINFNEMGFNQTHLNNLKRLL